MSIFGNQRFCAYSANQYPFSSGSSVHAYLKNTYHKDGSYSCYKGSCFSWTWWWGLRYIGYCSNQPKDTPTYSSTTTLLHCTTTTQKYSHLDTNTNIFFNHPKPPPTNSTVVVPIAETRMHISNTSEKSLPLLRKFNSLRREKCGWVTFSLPNHRTRKKKSIFF